MRIISGSIGGQRITPPHKMSHTRPTTDMAREGLFNTLQNLINLEDTHTLELFAGTGLVSYEFFSRGAKEMVIVEKDKSMSNFIRATLESLSISNARCLSMDVFSFFESNKNSYDIVFADPPYALPRLAEIPAIIFSKELLNPNGILIVEHDNKNSFDKHTHLFKTKKYGTTFFSFFENNV